MTIKTTIQKMQQLRGSEKCSDLANDCLFLKAKKSEMVKNQMIEKYNLN